MTLGVDDRPVACLSDDVSLVLPVPAWHPLGLISQELVPLPGAWAVTHHTDAQLSAAVGVGHSREITKSYSQSQ